MPPAPDMLPAPPMPAVPVAPPLPVWLPSPMPSPPMPQVHESSDAPSSPQMPDPTVPPGQGHHTSEPDLHDTPLAPPVGSTPDVEGAHAPTAPSPRANMPFMIAKPKLILMMPPRHATMRGPGEPFAREGPTHACRRFHGRLRMVE